MKRILKRFMPQTILLVLVAVFAMAAVSVVVAMKGSTDNKVDLSLVMTPETQLTVYVDGALSGELSREYSFGDTASITAPPVSGKFFSHWEADGSIVSYSTPLNLTMNAHTTLYAVYADVAKTKQAVSGFTSITRTNEGDKISFQAIAEGGSGTVEGAGIVYSTTASSETTLTINGAGVEQVEAKTLSDEISQMPPSVLDRNNCWMLQIQITPDNSSTVYHARTYVTVGGNTTYGDIKDVKLSALNSGISLVANPDGMNPEDEQDIKELLKDWKPGGGTSGGGASGSWYGSTTPEKPSMPELESKTDTRITVKEVPGQEYSIDGGKTWQTSGTFTGLTPETEYSIVTKITATGTANESPVSDALKVTTDKKADTSTPTAKPGETPGSTTAPTARPGETPESTTAPTAKPGETPGSTTTPTAKPGETPGSTAAPAKASTDKVTSTEKAKAKIKLNAGLKVSLTGKKVTVKWGKVNKADRYEVYAAYYGSGKCTKVKTLSGSRTSMTFTKLNGKKLNLKKSVKVYVAAYRKVNKKETRLAKSITVYAAGTKNAKYTNVKKIKLSKSKYTLKVKKTAAVKAEIVLVDKKKKQLPDSYAPEFRYASGNTKAATVDKNGKIKAVGKGTCYIYVYAKNGYAKKIKITVK